MLQTELLFPPQKASNSQPRQVNIRLDASTFAAVSRLAGATKQSVGATARTLMLAGIKKTRQKPA